ncbi:Dph6p [Sugiyamaella lignohabitans]|uniref:Diphthine--ammonia ligase n=1 Tax=Sugiyamaella lignohabitans TaxID=796027 RepID=A0A167E1G7_9ASCO|nr:Dph6p [Sugiyamaella lignohabitans]ANB13534.1 Dph6p [Sugiyamaella lignohabitans]
MKFVGLVSGGKDSCFNILHCINLGHELVALANLYPPADHRSDELDSFMYQTVGFHAVELYGEALGVPLYRSPILGKSIAQGLDYSETANDESEDLYLLLQKVKSAHPDVQGVSVGAILSTYQRTRVENVCSRLGLVSLAFLWQRSQAELLDEIIDSGVDARIIKTAGIGLNKTHLGKSLAEMRGELIKLNKIYGLHLCGEGGEYETLVFNAPIFRKKLVIVDTTIVDHSSDDVSYLRLRVVLEPKSVEERAQEAKYITTTPPLFETKFQDYYEEIFEDASRISEAPELGVRERTRVIEEVVIDTRNLLSVSNITSNSNTLEGEVEDVFTHLISTLKDKDLSIDSVVFVSLLISDMSKFQDINRLYNRYFVKPNPPARFCIQTTIPGNRQVQLSAIAVRHGKRDGLHVQGQSYWAPANIGPYSQAISSNGLTYLAGQIGLTPATMTLVTEPLQELVLSLQNISRVQEATCSDPAYGVAFVSHFDSSSAGLVEKLWDTYVESSSFASLSKPALLVAGVPGLPRNASYELTCLGIEKAYHIQYVNEHDELDSDDDSAKGKHEPLFVWPQEYSEATVLGITRFGHKTTITTASDSPKDLTEVAKESTYGTLISATVYSTIHSAADIEFPCEIIPTTWLNYRGKPVSIGAVFLFSH